MNTVSDYDVIVLGAGAAGAMCGWQAGLRGKKVLVLDHATRKAEKIRISGGGRCNFTNIHSTPKNFLSRNPHYCISALKRFGPWDFVDLVNQHNISWHDKGDGELFCDDRADKIIDMLFDGLASVGADVVMGKTITNVEFRDGQFDVTTEAGRWGSAKLVVATGGLSIPKIGATSFGYDLARKFGHTIVETRAGLVPFRFTGAFQDDLKALSGVSLEAAVRYGDVAFSGPVLFTHRGMSGPAILQISSYWQPGDPISIDLLPGQDARSLVETGRVQSGKKLVPVWLGGLLPQRFAGVWCRQNGFDGQLGALDGGELERLAATLSNWRVRPAGTEGYRTAEVTVGGVNTEQLSSKSMESKLQPGLYFIGEVVDVTGHLGGHNFQWAWASAHAAAEAF